MLSVVSTLGHTQEGVAYSAIHKTQRRGVEHRTQHKRVSMWVLLQQLAEYRWCLLVMELHWFCGVPSCCRQLKQQVVADAGVLPYLQKGRDGSVGPGEVVVGSAGACGSSTDFLLLPGPAAPAAVMGKWWHP